MSMIFQSYAIWPNMTVGENVGFGLELRKLPRAEIERRVDRHPRRRADAARSSGRYPAELSGGQQQRVALARAIVVEPEVLLLDEPLSNLDANLREEMRFEIRRLHDEFKITTVYVTHDQSEAMVTSDRIVVMNKGRIEQVDRAARALRQAAAAASSRASSAAPISSSGTVRPIHSGRSRSACRSPSRPPTPSRPRSSTAPISASTGITR